MRRSARRIGGALVLVVAVTAVAAATWVSVEARRTEHDSDVLLREASGLVTPARTGTRELERSWVERTRAANVDAATALLGRWLDGLVGSGGDAPGEPRGLSLREVRGSAREVARLVDDLPARDAKLDEDAGRLDRSRPRLVTTVGIDLHLRSSANPWRTHELVVRATMEPATGDPSRTLVRRWKVTRLELERDGLFTYDDPQVIVGEHATLVAERRNLELARSGFDFAESHLEALSSRYRALDGPTHAALFYVSSPSEATQVLGIRSPAGGYIAYANGVGDIALLNGVARSASYIDQVATIEHEMTHVVTLPFTRKGPELFTEGVAVFEEHRTIVADGTRHLVLDDLVRAFDDGDVDFQRLASEEESFRSDPAGAAVDYLVAGAVVHVLEELGGHAKVVAFYARLADGTPTAEALQSSFGLTIPQLERRTRQWAVTNVNWSG